MCFSPQRRAIFQHLNFKNWSGADMFCTFWLQNVLLATAACHFWTSQLQKVLRTPEFLACSLQNALLATAACNFWFLLWPHDSAPAALTSLLFDSPDTRIIGKNTAFPDFSNIWRGWIFFLLTFALLHLLSSDFTSSHLLFICFSTLHIVGSLLFLPSNIHVTTLVLHVSAIIQKTAKGVSQKVLWLYSDMNIHDCTHLSTPFHVASLLHTQFTLSN